MSGAIPQIYFERVKAHFNGDINRTWMWFKSLNSDLGMISPLDAIRDGRKNKLVTLIDNMVGGRK